ncbi:MAG TPA: hypothetical protein VKW76_05975 [Candidatus Binatia bacterium]|nr:hypothetical protein [Candidatus Binatia bacterium]
MGDSRRVLVVAALMLSILGRTTVATPAGPMACPKVSGCCRRYCAHGAARTRPNDCCHVRPQASEAALLTATPNPQPALAAGFGLQQVPGTSLGLRAPGGRFDRPVEHGPPLFLATCSLRR